MTTPAPVRSPCRGAGGSLPALKCGARGEAAHRLPTCRCVSWLAPRRRGAFDCLRTASVTRSRALARLLGSKESCGFETGGMESSASGVRPVRLERFALASGAGKTRVIAIATLRSAGRRRGGTWLMTRLRGAGVSRFGEPAMAVLGPAGAGCRHLRGEYLSCSWLLEHALGTIPFGRDDEQGLPVGASKRAGEAAAIQLYGL